MRDGKDISHIQASNGNKNDHYNTLSLRQCGASDSYYHLQEGVLPHGE